MIIKSFEVNKVKFSRFKSILLYGLNKGFKEEVIKSNISSGFSGEILRYEEAEVLDNKDTILEGLINGSLFDGVPRTLGQAAELKNMGIDFTHVIEIQVYDVSSNFDPVIGTKLSCSGIYYTQSNSSSYVANDNGYGGSETFTTFSGDNGYTERIRIYHYYGSETGNISFKIKIEEQ